MGKNLPPCSGAVKWVRALHERVKDPMEKLTSLNKLVMETDESREVTELYERIAAQFEEYDTRCSRTGPRRWTRRAKRSSSSTCSRTTRRLRSRDFAREL